MSVSRVIGRTWMLASLALVACSAELPDEGEGAAGSPVSSGGFGGEGGFGGSMAPMVPPPHPQQPLPPVGGADGVPCDVATILHDHCTLCHASPPSFGAPMPLMALSDFHAKGVSDPSKQVHTLVSERIHSNEPSRQMPPPSAPQLEPAERDALSAWLAGGAIAGATSCPISNPMSPAHPMAGDGGVPMTPVNPGGSGGLSEQPIAYDDPEMVCYELVAHAPGDKNAPYSVGIATDSYVNFDFAAPWSGTMYARSYRAVLNNLAVVHHWLLYKNEGPKLDGAVSHSIGAHPDGQLVHGWAPGGTEIYFDPDVGTAMPGDTSYTLELHYNNDGPGADPSAIDMSGVEVCVTPKVPEHVATMSWLGTNSIGGTQATGTCEPFSNERIHIIGGTPHMHKKGTHMKVEHLRANGTIEIIHDMPFDFAYQRGYAHDLWLDPGDRIRTTCTYNAPASFGEGTNDEMCYWFAMHYPPLALTNGNFVAQLAHGANTCLQ